MQPRHSSLLLLAALICWPPTRGSLFCENGGTFDDVNYECICTPNYYGSLCETSFAESDPCANWRSVEKLQDQRAVHRLGNAEPCELLPDQPCVDFSAISIGWYRLDSPAGGQLISRVPTGNVDCGSHMPYFLLNRTIVQEDNANRMLFRARAHRYRPGFSGGFLPDDTSYPVRILKCYSALTLYYLQPLPSSLSHYCIGDKQPCDLGLTSVEGTGFEPCIGSDCLPQLIENSIAPQLRLDYHRLLVNDRYRASFSCNVYSAFQVNSSQANGVLHQIEYELTFRNGTSMTVSRCRWQDVRIGAGENRTFECRSEFVLTSQINVYGGSLACRVRAKCDSAGAQYDSMPLVSNIHGFYFRHWFQGGSNVIKPDMPSTLCIDSKLIPALEEVTFFISVGRQQIMLTDRIDVSVIRRDGNESLSCGFKMINNRYKEKRICQDMVLYNHDPDQRVPLGLTQGQQISVIHVNITFSSNANGLFTRFRNGTAFRQKIQSIELKVNLASLQTNVKTYLHVYTDPRVKPANVAYGRGDFPIHHGHYTLLYHKMLPYEIQMNVDGKNWYATEIAIRYFYYIIRIYGSSSSGTIQNPVIKYLPPKGEQKRTLPIKPDGLPFGVTVENVGAAMKVQFDLYGTILYVWAFSMGRSACNSFVMNSESMRKFETDSACKGYVVKIGDRIALDLMIVPGFYDTQNLVDGLIFGTRRKPIADSSKSLFHSFYEMPKIREFSRMQPTEILGICTCNDAQMTRSNCFVSLENTRRDRREAAQTVLKSQIEPIRQIQTREISQQEADEFCNTFVQLQLSKSVSTEICAQAKDPTGQADYISQFKVICAQYATVLGTFDSTQPLFNSMLGMCYTEMTYNATAVLGNSSKIEALVEDLCPANCSGRGQCLSGECTCVHGFWGPSCEFEIARRDEMPIEVELLQRNIFCASDRCTAVYLRVKPLLKSTDSVCDIHVNSSLNYSAPSAYISGDIVKCELQDMHDSLVEDVRMYMLLNISLTAPDWESSNSVPLLLHQAQCDGRPVTCSSELLTCQAEGLQPESNGGNDCPPTIKKQGLRLRTANFLVVGAVLIALINYC
ncbi:hypothetical protein BOX15_Mlig008132g1 [Macrostomum lignano]|uniref:EGF-like domain-containing protein n=1 Tax=Macrostomum lignano TaxID=282301 RepID=A0A267G7M1_9PLAT|nr:hypothetical protein BOX15_Mlig008132g1 [Macrostomum lignano]